jgi:Protein of unknown function (DUF1580)
VIDIKKERLYAFKYARRWFPRRRRGKRPAIATLHRYVNQGYHGVVLEFVQVAGTRCTSQAAVARFLERITNLSPCPGDTSHPSRPKTAQQIDQALEEAGFDRRPVGSRTKPECPRGSSGLGQVSQQASGSTGVTVRDPKNTSQRTPHDEP